MKKHTAIFLLIIVTIIWGGGFVAIKLSLDAGVSAGMLNMIRGLIFTVIVFAIFPRQVLGMSKEQLINGLLVGVFNFIGFILQAVGAMYTTPSNSSFLTTTNVVMVPFLAWILYKNKPRPRNIVAVFVCMAGMAVLTDIVNVGLRLNIGDIYTIAGALGFGLSIVLLAKQPEGGHFAAGSFLLGLTLFLGGLVYMLFFENASFAAVDWKAAILPILYLAIGSNFIAQSMQIVAQRHLSASTASLVMMLEGVFGSVFSILYGFEKFTMGLLTGGGLILASLIISEVQIIKAKK
ncbi:MAG: DMT family transporter [Oscillospiraceae bacterium]|nr:DMT family transporter [Oscillospiraceae bacterium]